MQKIIVIVGPTAVGKTTLGIKLSKAIGGEVISADSRQVYRGLDIGSGKVTTAEAQGVPHHMISIADPKERYSAADFVNGGRAAISKIAARGHVPIIVGGTGFYIDALIGSITLADVPPHLSLRKKLATLSLVQLQSHLKKLDPARFKEIDTKNPVRLIRAIEIATARGKTPLEKPHPLYDTLFIGVTLPPLELKKKIHDRLVKRAAGILQEAKKLHEKDLSWKRMEELGLEYRCAALYLQKKLTKEEMLRTLESEIVKYAKRQMTWFKRNPSILWLSPKDVRTAVQRSRTFLGLRKKVV